MLHSDGRHERGKGAPIDWYPPIRPVLLRQSEAFVETVDTREARRPIVPGGGLVLERPGRCRLPQCGAIRTLAPVLGRVRPRRDR